MRRKLPIERLKKISRGWEAVFLAKVPKRHTFMAYIKFGSDLKKFKQQFLLLKTHAIKGAG